MAAIAAERDLLFGLLALHNGLIDQGQLVAAFQAWTRDKARPLADHLAARGDLDDDQRAGVEAMVGLHLKKQGGDMEKSLAVIAAGLSTRESLAALGVPEIEHTLTQLGPAFDGDPDRTASYAVGAATSDGQRFRVLRPHARGGLGAVFIALDAELHREVALKQILDHHADDPTVRARFVLEAEITGGLEHPGIVPVYGLGTYPDGRPYYATRFVRGDTLKQAVDCFRTDASLEFDPGRRSLELRQLLRRFIDVCNVIGYAHSRGVLHRDIKPGNVIVGKHAETLVVDWGLAKATGLSEPRSDPGERTLVPSSSSGSAETLPGSVLGTPAYMSPEQAGGELERLGPRSDVYSLGATLHYLLTGRPPAGGDVGDVLRAVQQGDIPPPRRYDATIDRALEAVCLKAMALRPADRYATPKALAEDVERWMADEPVGAWSEPFNRRAQRWMRRNRTAVAAAAVLLVSAVGGLSVGTVVLGRANAAIQEQRDLARANLRKAQQAVDEYFTQVSENTLLKSPLPGLQPLRHDLLKTALRYYQDFTRQAGANPASRAELARAYFRMGEILVVVGSKEEAFLQFTRAEAIWEELLKQRPGDAGYREELAKTVVSAAGIQNRDLGRPDESLRNSLRAQALYQGLASESPQREEYQAGLAKTFGELADWYYLNKRGEDEARESQKAHDIYARLSAANPRYRLDAARMAMNLGFWNTRGKRVEEALRYLGEARAILEAVNREQPGDLALQSEVARVNVNMGYTHHMVGRYEEALPFYESATGMLERLARENPRVISCLNQLAGAYKQQAFLLRRMKRYDLAVDRCRRAIAVLEDALANLAPDSFKLQSSLAESFTIIGENSFEAGLFDQAADAFSQSIHRHQALLDKNPDNVELQQALGRAHVSYGMLHTRMHRPDDAIRSYQAAIGVIEPSSRIPRGDFLALQILARSYERIGWLQRNRGRLHEAVVSLAAAVKRLEAILLVTSSADDDLIELASALATLAETQLALDQRAEATGSLRAARTRLEAVQSVSGDSLVTQAAVRLLSGRIGEESDRAPAQDGAMDLLRRAISMGYGDIELLRTGPALDSLRDRDDFRLMMMDLEMPADPFASAR
jgi:eukaryotic-like serine/threonine-protein kinase